MTTPHIPPTTSGQEIDRGTYEVIRDRLLAQAKTLAEKTNALNQRRLDLFGSSELAIIGSERIRTVHNCIPRDIINAGRYMLFGYNVFIGLKTETKVEDVFSLHWLEKTETGFAFQPVPPGSDEDFLSHPQFVKDFQELYRYYKEARLLQLRVVEGKILAIFQTGALLKDIKVFRWAVDPKGKVTYLDNRGERDHIYPPSHDFVWTQTTREDQVGGKFPHISILDQVFVETIGGNLTIKIEDNTESGAGIYEEPVEDPRQSLDDAEVYFAKLGGLILLKILPFREKHHRYFVFNLRTKTVVRIDAIGQACVQLPEDHGIIFPGGYYLQSGEYKTYGESTGMEYKRMVRSPNGEDVLYIFHRRDEGRNVLLPYNKIRKEVALPIDCHGYSKFDDGRLVVLKAPAEPTRVHPMQIWQTPFTSDEYAAAAPSTGTFLESIGNAELVRGISDALSIQKLIVEQTPTTQVYEDLIATVNRTLDSYFWLDTDHAGNIGALLTEIRATAELIVDEFEKVEELRKQAAEATEKATAGLRELIGSLRLTNWTTLEAYVTALTQLRGQRGHVISLREVRYIDLSQLEKLEHEVIAQFDRVSSKAVEFLRGDKALQPYHVKIAKLVADAEPVTTVLGINPHRATVEKIGAELDLLTEVIGGLKIEDTLVRTKILEDISEVMGGLNRARAIVEARRKELLSRESVAEFGAQFKLFAQSVSSALSLADSPEKCDAQMGTLMLRLEEIESRFSEFDEFQVQLAEKRDDVMEAFQAKRQMLVEQRQRRAEHTFQAADRVLQGIKRRLSTFKTADDLNAYFAADQMVAKVRELIETLRKLEDSVKADEVESRLKSTREDALRVLRDRQDLFEGTAVVKFGRHRLSVNTQPLELTMLPRQGSMMFHLSGTDFFQPVADAGFDATRELWEQSLVSETPEVYRGEYLAFCLLSDAESGSHNLSLEKLRDAELSETGLIGAVRIYAETRYDEGYERGIHDADAALILARVLQLYRTAGRLRFAPGPRALACLFWAFLEDDLKREQWGRQARSLARLRTAFGSTPAIELLIGELMTAITEFLTANHIPFNQEDLKFAGTYLFEEMSRPDRVFVTSGEAVTLSQSFTDHLNLNGQWQTFAEDLAELRGDLGQSYRLASAWLEAFVASATTEKAVETRLAVAEAVALLLTDGRLERMQSSTIPGLVVDGLLGQHPRLSERRLMVRLDEFLMRLGRFRTERVPKFRAYQEQRHGLLRRERERLRLDEFTPKVMSSFVRNRLINDVYLPLIGDNLAKQIGVIGDGKRTDLMGMLLLISPPGYGKTTLMEYIANRLGLVFMKINGPALGHKVTSLDPMEAPNATARREIEKLNLALEMGNNVMLYIDDIQHTNPEFLQKFISLCDAQRKIEGVWNGQTQTYDLRGKRFCVCMAGNPYTESGQKFQIPDMLANRSDTYNLGDVLTGRETLFELSYLENALTSNRVLAPLTTREPDDVYKLVQMAKGEAVQSDQLSHGYSGVEIGEMVSVLKNLLQIQQTVLKVNQQYIRSASQDDAYRTEPPFKLQGSYRNMNKLAEKVVAVMNPDELENLLDDHYLGESQTLTTSAEHNLLKLAELRGRMSPEQTSRWNEIKRGFARVKVMGGKDDDPVVKVTGQIGLVSERLEDICAALTTLHSVTALHTEQAARSGDLSTYLTKLDQTLNVLRRVQTTPATDPALTALLGSVASGLEKVLTQQAAPPAIEVKSATTNGAELAPYLNKLDQTLEKLATTSAKTAVVQTLSPGVYDLLNEMLVNVESALLPMVRSLAREVSTTPGVETKISTQLDRTLKNLDMLKDLLKALRKIETGKG